MIDYERELWEAWKRQDLSTIERLTAPDYYTVSEHGPEQAVGIDEIRADFARYHLREYRLGQVAARQLSPDVIALIYNAYVSATFDGEDISREVAEASIWVRREGKWLNVLLHEITRPGFDRLLDR